MAVAKQQAKRMPTSCKTKKTFKIKMIIDSNRLFNAIFLFKYNMRLSLFFMTAVLIIHDKSDALVTIRLIWIYTFL